MKALKNHLILFDADCPMCSMYTNAFVKAGILEQNGRVAYQQIAYETCPMVDRQRAVNEIALVNLETGEVSYGIKSIFKIFAVLMPAFERLFAFAPFVWLMSKVYAFISYNRRVIIPAAQTGGLGFQPTFRLNYRIAYLVFTWAITSCILTNYAGILNGVVPVGNSYREFLVCGGQIFFQGIIVNIIAKDKQWNYLGNMMTISFAGALLLLPVLVVSLWLGHHPLFYTGYFLCVAGLMFLEHIRRSKLLQIGWTLTISWAVYRALVLLLILLIN